MCSDPIGNGETRPRERGGPSKYPCKKLKILWLSLNGWNGIRVWDVPVARSELSQKDQRGFLSAHPHAYAHCHCWVVGWHLPSQKSGTILDWFSAPLHWSPTRTWNFPNECLLPLHCPVSGPPRLLTRLLKRFLACSPFSLILWLQRHCSFGNAYLLQLCLATIPSLALYCVQGKIRTRSLRSLSWSDTTLISQPRLSMLYFPPFAPSTLGLLTDP